MIAPINGHIFRTLEETNFEQSKPQVIDHYFLGAKGAMLPGPEAYLADVAEGYVVTSHFHRIDQYQILFGSPGSYYQRTPLPKVLLHYADAYSVYGPFGAGPTTHLNFFTLRATASDFRGAMPKDRDELLYNGHRHLKIDLESLIEEGAPSKDEVLVDELIAPESDGLAAYMMRIGPNAVATPPDGELRTGRYGVVLDGELRYDGRAFGARSLGWSSGDVPELVLHGGPHGASVVFLHMPYPQTPMVQLANMWNENSAIAIS